MPRAAPRSPVSKRATPAKPTTKPKPRRSLASTAEPKLSKLELMRIQEFEEQQEAQKFTAGYNDLPLYSIIALVILDLLFLAFSFIPSTSAKTNPK